MKPFFLINTKKIRERLWGSLLGSPTFSFIPELPEQLKQYERDHNKLMQSRIRERRGSST